MINKSIVDGFTSLDGCYKLSDSDCTIDCYVIPRSILERKKEIDDWELKTNSVYLLIGEQDDKIMAYAGKGELGKDKESAMRRLQQHLTKNAELTEKYFSFWTQALVFVCKNTDPGLQWDTSITGDLEAILIGDIKYEYNWKGKSESIRNPLSPDRIRGHAVKLACIKGYVKELGFTFLDEDNTAVSSKNLSKNSSGSTIVTEEEIAKQEKQIIDKTVALETKNLEINARIPEYTTPEKVVNQMLDLLPWDTFNHETRFLDLACKGGEFLALIHDRLSVVLQKDEYFSKYTGKEKDVRIHDYIVNNQLYGVAIGDNSYAITMDRVYDCPHIVKAKTGAQGYINYIKCLSGADIKKQYEKQQILKAKQSYINEILGVQNMKFDVVIGNPPYQDEKNSIYPRFVELGIALSDTTCMITRDNWMNGKAFKGMRQALNEDGAVSKIIHYPVVGELFSAVRVAVAIFKWDRNYKQLTDYKCIKKGIEVVKQQINTAEGIIYKSDIAKSIITKSRSSNKWTEIYNTRSYPFMDQRKRYDLDTVAKPSGEYKVAVMANKEETVYTKLCNFKNIDEVTQCKVVCGVIINEASKENPGNVLTNIKAIGPYVVSSESWSLIATFNTEKETVNCKSYIKTKFVRFLANQTVNGRSNVTDNTFEFVPLQNFTATSDIDWSQPISNIDQQLYKKYNLSEEEVAYIESTIKSLDTTVQASPTRRFTLQEAEANLINRRIQNEEF